MNEAEADQEEQRISRPEAVDKLFVYGSLAHDENLQLLTGRKFPSKDAILLNHRRIAPKNSFAFAVYWRGYSMRGRLLFSVPPEIIRKLDEYEGEGHLYVRRLGLVRSGNETHRAWVYRGKVNAIKSYIKKGYEERDRIEEFVEKNVARYLEQKADHFIGYEREQLAVKVTKELLSEEVHSLLRQYFRQVGLPSFIIKHEIEKASIPRLNWLKEDTTAQRYADNYMRLAIGFMIFNQLEEKFRTDYRKYVKVSDAYYMHTLSALMALKLLVDYHQSLESALAQLGVDRWDPNMLYSDYAAAAIFIADELYTRSKPQYIVDWVKSNRHPGAVPMGAELEFSNLGYKTIGARAHEDPQFDAFYYFYDFDLMRRGWKLGAHVDDHGFLTSANTRTRGFLELAFGRYKLLGDVSKPATQDAWVLSQIIDLAVRFVNIRPHSLHLSYSASSPDDFRPLEDLDPYLCLLILGGDLREDDHGILREMRIYHGEILSQEGSVIFSRLNRHHKHPEDSSWSFVIEYQFPRLYYDYDYQPIILALKGFQLSVNPYPLKGCRRVEQGGYGPAVEKALKKWAQHPTAVSQGSLDHFLAKIEEGLSREAELLQNEAYRRYSMRILARIEERLKRRNMRIAQYHEQNKREAVADSASEF
ncbi:MAG: gamma-glutamylcyclotransferase [candidate division KSB1 bacterium]|nr:gamma-glutamylcyclotransferase [candidate division KSB1 bacterium]MDZ7347095.1 gamma-glutamylcyclotransferase [candidate division KSB1 bacterium]